MKASNARRRSRSRELAPGKSITCTGTHTITQEDLNNGSFKDTASASSKEAKRRQPKTRSKPNRNRSSGLTKTDNLNPAKYNKVGQVVTYTLTATNEGNITLHEVTVSDSPALEGFKCTPAIPVAELAPGKSVTCTGTHTITQEDLNNGSFKDTGSASQQRGQAPPAEDTITAEQKPKLGLTKTDNLKPAKYNKVGQVVTYTLTATNEGNITLHEVTVSDSPPLEGFKCTPTIPAGELAAGGLDYLHGYARDHPGRPQQRLLHGHGERDQQRGRGAGRGRHDPRRTELEARVDEDGRPETGEVRQSRPGRDLHADGDQRRQQDPARRHGERLAGA